MQPYFPLPKAPPPPPLGEGAKGYLTLTPDRRSSAMMQAVQDGVEGGTRTHRRLHLCRIGAIIPTEIHRLAFHSLQFLKNHINFASNSCAIGAKILFKS